MGRTDVEDALIRLDSLTKEESLMAMASNLEVTQHVEHDVKEIKALAEDTDDRVQVIEERTQGFIPLFRHAACANPIHMVSANRNRCFSACVTS
jgi:hypothetical protein